MKDFTKEEIIENNKLLAKFLGWIEPSDDWLDGWFGTKNRPIGRKYRPNNSEDIPCLIKSEDNKDDVYFDSFMRYHNNWEWLMTVVEKIESEGYKVLFHYDNFYILNEDDDDDEGDVVKLNWDKINKETVFNGVVEFIKWYNENK